MRIFLSHVIVFSIVIAASNIALTQTIKKNNFNTSGKLVAIESAVLETFAPQIQSTGRLVPTNSVVVTARIGEEVVKSYAKIGGNVEKGQILFTLSSADIKRSIKQLKAEHLLESTSRKLLRSQLIIRKAKVRRAKRLRDKKALSQDSYESTKILALEVEQQIALRNYNITKIELSLEQEKENLRNTKVLAPIAGNITKIHVQEGKLLVKGEEVASIFNQDSSEIETSLRANIASKVLVRSLVNIQVNDYVSSGYVRSIVNLENMRTGTRILRITPDAPLPKAFAVIGTRFTLKTQIGIPEPKLLIPKDALIPRGREQFVFTYENGIAKKKNVTLGDSVGFKIIIKSGLKVGEKVIVKGNEGLRPNQRVRLN